MKVIIMANFEFLNYLIIYKNMNLFPSELHTSKQVKCVYI